METNYLVVMSLIFIASVSLGIVVFRRSAGIFFGKETKPKNIVLISAGRGIATSLFLFSGVYLFAVLTGKAAQASPEILFQSFLLFLIPGLIIFLGSLSEFFQVSRVRKK